MTVAASAAVKPLKATPPAVPAVLPVRSKAVVLPRPVIEPVPARLPLPVGAAPVNATPVKPVKLPLTAIDVAAWAFKTPPTVPLPDKVNVPLPLMAVRPPVASAPRVKSPWLVICVVPPVRPTAPVKALPAFVSVIAFEPALKVDAPATDQTSPWVMPPPVVVTNRPSPPMLSRLALKVLLLVVRPESAVLLPTGASKATLPPVPVADTVRSRPPLPSSVEVNWMVALSPELESVRGVLPPSSLTALL